MRNGLMMSIVASAALVSAAFIIACEDDGDQAEPTPSPPSAATQTIATPTAIASSDSTSEATADPSITPGPPVKIELVADPRELACDGERAAVVTARVYDADALPVADGTDVTFSVLALGTADPIRTTTVDGEATSSVVALASGEGVVVNVTSGDAATSVRIDCL